MTSHKDTIDLADKKSLMSREAILRSYLPHVKRIIQRISTHLPPSVDAEDLFQAGVIGLMEAMDRYDPERKNSFITYAAFRIKGAVLSELRSRDFLSRDHRKRVREYQAACDRMERELGRPATDEEIAAALEMDLKEFYDIKRMAGFHLISFEDVGCFSEEKRSLLDTLSETESLDALKLTRVKELHAGLAQAVMDLPEKEKLLISLYYYDELTMKEIGEVLSVSESRVSQIHSRAIARLRSVLRRMSLIR